MCATHAEIYNGYERLGTVGTGHLYTMVTGYVESYVYVSSETFQQNLQHGARWIAGMSLAELMFVSTKSPVEDVILIA